MLDQFSEVLYLAKGVARNKWIITVVAWVICLGGWMVVYKMPDIYESSARVHVDTRTMLRPLLRGLAVQSDVKGLVLIMQRLMFTQQNMIKVAELAGMDIDLTSEINTLEVVNRLKKSVTITGSRSEIFTINYESRDPQNAKNVVQAVLSVFSAQTQQSNITDVDTAQRFIDNQIKEYEQRLRNAERAKETFKRENIGMLPGQAGGGQIGHIQQVRQKLEESKMQLSEVQSKKKVLKMQLVEALESGDEWGLTELMDNDSIDAGRLAALEARRNDLLLKYTEKHPNIISIDYLIDEIKKRQQEKDLLNTGGFSFKAMSNPYVQTIKVELNKIETDLATIKSRVYSFNKKLQLEDRQFNQRLAVETEMQNLNRDYGSIKKNYMALIDSREKARMSNSVDTQVSALKFKVVDPANLPVIPASPNRPILYSVVLLIGFLAGIGLALVKVIIRPTIIEVKQLREITGLPVLGSVSEVVTEAQTKTNLFGLVRFVFANVLLLLGYSGAMALEILS